MITRNARSTIGSSASPAGLGPERHRESGGALLEFVILLPVLAMLLFGVWEFGRIFDAWLVSTNAAREGARYGAESTLTGTAFQTYVRDRVRNYLDSGYGARLNLGDVHVPDSNITVEELANNQIRVIVRADVDIWAPAVGVLARGNTFTVTAWSTMWR